VAVLRRGTCGVLFAQPRFAAVGTKPTNYFDLRVRYGWKTTCRNTRGHTLVIIIRLTTSGLLNRRRLVASMHPSEDP